VPLSPIITAAAMGLSSVSVIGNALQLRFLAANNQPDFDVARFR
jgi:hypothetical protein